MKKIYVKPVTESFLQSVEHHLCVGTNEPAKTYSRFGNVKNTYGNSAWVDEQQQETTLSDGTEAVENGVDVSGTIDSRSKSFNAWGEW